MTTRILLTEHSDWLTGKKTKGLLAKSMSALFVDTFVIDKFLIDTLEGEEPIDIANMFCIGETRDAWQQTPKALLTKYKVDFIDNSGWMHCSPKPENEVQFFEFTSDMAGAERWVIQGIWGKTIRGLGKDLQEIEVGDFVCRQPHDHTDQWVVRRKLFLNSYTALTQ